LFSVWGGGFRVHGGAEGGAYFLGGGPGLGGTLPGGRGSLWGGGRGTGGGGPNNRVFFCIYWGGAQARSRPWVGRGGSRGKGICLVHHSFLAACRGPTTEKKPLRRAFCRFRGGGGGGRLGRILSPLRSQYLVNMGCPGGGGGAKKKQTGPKKKKTPGRPPFPGGPAGGEKINIVPPSGGGKQPGPTQWGGGGGGGVGPWTLETGGQIAALCSAFAER